MNKTTLARVLLITATVIWGSTFFLIKDALNIMHPVSIMAWRFSISAFFLLPSLWIYKSEIKSCLTAGVILGLLLWLGYLVQTWGMIWTKAANSGFITGLLIVFIPIFQIIFFKTWLGFRQLLSIMIATVGLWFLTGGASGFNRGDFLTLICAISFALHILVIDQSRKKSSNPLLLNFIQCLVTGVLSFALGASFSLPLTITGLKSWTVIFYLAVFATVFCLYAQIWAQKYLPPIQCSLILILEPIFGALFAWQFGHESFTYLNIFGAVLIVGALVLANLFYPSPDKR